MADFYKGVIPIFDPDTPMGRDGLHPKDASFGAVPRDFSVQPAEMFDSPSAMDLIPQSDWDAWYDEQEAKQSSLELIFLPNGPNGPPAFVNLDQNGQGYCWSYSTGHSTMLNILKTGVMPARLNPHAVAAIIKGGRDEGGWGGLSAQFAREHGEAEEGTGPGQWPKWSMNVRTYDTPELRASMAKYKTLESWVDLTKNVYDQNLTRAQLFTAFFQNNAGPVDFNWWGHSVCGVRPVRISAGNWGLLILNSWLGWGHFGLGVLQGNKAIPDGALSIRSIAA